MTGMRVMSAGAIGVAGATGAGTTVVLAACTGAAALAIFFAGWEAAAVAVAAELDRLVAPVRLVLVTVERYPISLDNVSTATRFASMRTVFLVARRRRQVNLKAECFEFDLCTRFEERFCGSVLRGIPF